MKSIILAIILAFFCAVPTSAGVRILALACDARVPASTARVRIWSATGDYRSSYILCGQQTGVALAPGDRVELVARVRHATLGSKACRLPLPDWYGAIVCSMEGIQVEAEMR